MPEFYFREFSIFYDFSMKVLISRKKYSSLTVESSGFFSVTRILREINFGESRSSKTGVFAISGALNFVNLVHFSV